MCGRPCRRWSTARRSAAFARRVAQAASLCAAAAALTAGVSVFGTYLPTMGGGAVVQALPEAPDVVEAAEALTPYRDLTLRPAPGDTDRMGRLP
ncbi:hypothetical protein ACGRHY_05320 [Streptomyces sp. HK10]|uniref:hypothetical protein n=1 Tax=Streptomyces sp. HK10 TaxID=3373255 RepID=UPI0037479A17